MALFESGNYPPGAENDPSAPYNRAEVPERDFDVFISQTLSKETYVTTTDYIYVNDKQDEYEDTSDTDWEEAYKQCHMTPLEIIKEFKKYLESHRSDPITNMSEYRRERYLIEECENWCEDETEILEN